MNRRNLLKLLLSTPIAAHLDIEKLLWIPGEKTIFIPSSLSAAQILNLGAVKFNRAIPRLFERDDLWYAAALKACEKWRREN